MFFPFFVLKTIQKYGFFLIHMQKPDSFFVFLTDVFQVSNYQILSVCTDDCIPNASRTHPERIPKE